MERDTLIAVILALIGLTGAAPSKSSVPCGKRKMDVIYEWKVIKYATPPDFKPDPGYQTNSSYISGITVGKDVLYLSTPRVISNLPATFSTVPKDQAGSKSPILQPYPNLAWNTVNISNPDCNGTLISVEKSVLDNCNRLWVLDTGVIFNILNYRRICPPKIVIFDINTNQAVRNITVPSNVLTPISDLFTITLDDQFVKTNTSSTSCDDLFVYMGDVNTPAVIVHRSPGDLFYRIAHPFMSPDQVNMIIAVDGELISFFKGVIGIDVLGRGHDRCLYFQPLASNHIYCLPAIVVQEGPFEGDPVELPVYLAVNKSSPGSHLHVDKADDCLMYNPLSEGSIVGWNQKTKEQKTLLENPKVITVVEDMKPDPLNKYITYATIPRVEQYLLQKVNTNEIYNRIVKITLTQN